MENTPPPPECKHDGHRVIINGAIHCGECETELDETICPECDGVVSL